LNFKVNSSGEEDALFPPVKSILNISSTSNVKPHLTISINIKSNLASLINSSSAPQTSPAQTSSPTDFSNLLESKNNHQVKNPMYNKTQPVEPNEINGVPPLTHKTNDYLNTYLPTPSNSPINAKKVSSTKRLEINHTQVFNLFVYVPVSSFRWSTTMTTRMKTKIQTVIIRSQVQQKIL
jgi:hypothetical protein